MRRVGYLDAKLRTLLETAGEVLGPGGEATGLRVVDDRGEEHRGPALVLASNNPYAMNAPGRRGSRPVLDSGRLGIIVIDAPGDHRAPARTWTAPALEIHGEHEIVHAGVDGEAIELRTLLRIAIRPAALRLRIRAAPRTGRVPGGRSA